MKNLINIQKPKVFKRNLNYKLFLISLLTYSHIFKILYKNNFYYLKK